VAYGSPPFHNGESNRRAALEHDFFAAWAWGLRWAGPHDYQVS
jgi:hypothetical protein